MNAQDASSSTRGDGGEYPLACDDSEEESMSIGHGKVADPERPSMTFEEVEHAGCRDSSCPKEGQGPSHCYEKEEEVAKKVLQCPECGKEYICKKAYRGHLHEHRFGRTFECNVCSKCFSSKTSISKHMRSHLVENVECKVCGRTFKNSLVLKSHMVQHGDRRFACEQCHKSFLNLALLKEHRTSHVREKIYPCDVCVKVFHSRELLRKHKYTHKGGPTRRHCCDQCGRKFVSARELTDHVRIHTGDKPFLCPECGDGFAVKCNLKVHMKRHSEWREPSLKCELCGQEYAHRNSLERHKKISHMGLKEFRCDVCGQEFTQKHNLTNHVKKKHSGACDNQ